MKPDLDEIEARCNAATEGPWRIEEFERSWYVEMPPATEHLVDERMVEPNDFTPGPQDRKNAEFIAHARQDIPALLEYCRELEAILKDHVFVEESATKGISAMTVDCEGTLRADVAKRALAVVREMEGK